MSFTGKPETFLNTTLANDGFFPDVNLGDFQRLYRVPAEYKQALVEHHLRIAMADCNRSLATQKTLWVMAGHNSLAQVNDATLGGVNEMVTQYQRAVFCRGMGLLVRAFTSLNRREQAENLAKEGVDVVQDYFAESLHAVRRLKGIGENITVELL